MSTGQNVELALKMVEAINARDEAALVGMTSPDVEWHSFFAQLGEGGLYRGHEGIRQWLRDIDDAWEVVLARIDDTVGVGDVVLLIGRLEYRGRESGAGAEEAAGWIVRFRGGKLDYFRAFREPEEALMGLAAPRPA